MPEKSKQEAGAADINPRIKIQDVAKLARVSPATVSRVLNHPDLVRPDLRSDVERAIAKLSYTRDSAARTLKSRRSRIIGAVVPTLGLSIFADGVEALQNRLSESGYTLLLASSQYDVARELREVRALIEQGIDGVVLVGNGQVPELHDLLRRREIACVTTYVVKARPGVPSVGLDNKQAAHDMARHLLAHGHRDFSIIASLTPFNDRTEERVSGFLEALAMAGIQLPREAIVHTSHSLSDGQDALRAILKARPGVTAVMCTTDTLAIGVLSEARRQGLHVPRQLSVTGFDDMELSSHFDPPLTTIGVPAIEIGRTAADCMIDAVTHKVVPPTTSLPYRLVLRGSSGDAPALVDPNRNRRRC